MKTTAATAAASPRGKDENREARLEAVRTIFDAVRNGEKANQALFREVKVTALVLYPDHEALEAVKTADTSAIRAEYEALGLAKSLLNKAVKAAQNNYNPLIRGLERGLSRADIMAAGKSGLEGANALANKLKGINIGVNLALGKDPMEVIKAQAACIQQLGDEWQTFEHLFEEGKLLLAPAITTLLQQGISAATIADHALVQEKLTAKAVKVAAM